VVNRRSLAADDFPHHQVGGLRAEGANQTLRRFPIAKILGGLAEVQQIGDGKKDRQRYGLRNRK
jgi:hypothetical protein